MPQVSSKPRTARSRRGFSLVEFMIASTISATLLAATMSALDTSYKSYKVATESASLNMSARLAMHRITTLIRNGEEFGPFPTNPIAEPRIETDTLELVAFHDSDSDLREVWTIRLVPATLDETNRGLGPNKLEADVTRFDDSGELASFTQPLVYRVTDARFLLEYDVGPTLRRATVDLTVGERQDRDDGLMSDLEAPQIRMVSSVRPRRINPT
ncbi:MAG: prepilin-type N-terminal cleavage/methylation domain-containing protein [Planctomycetota bacterium]